MEESATSAGGSPRPYAYAKEGSPLYIFVSDDGWTVLRTRNDEIIIIRVDGREHKKIEILQDGLNKSERKDYVQQGHLSWHNRAYDYICAHEGRVYFVIRTWWDRRIIVDLISGRFVQDRRNLTRAFRPHALRTEPVRALIVSHR